jgi:L-seryl-tRNA(Ser) seleniumtransferase
MPLPPSWTRDLLGGSLDEVAAKLKNSEAVRDLQTRAAHLLGEFPATAAKGIDRLLRETRRGSEQLRRWARRHSSTTLAAINGSGVWMHDTISGAPLSSEQLDAMLPGDDLAPLYEEGVALRLEQALQQRVASLVGESCLVSNSFAAAVAALGASLPPGAAVIVPRPSVFRVDGGRPIVDLLAAGGAKVVEVGSVESCSTEEIAHAMAGQSGPVFAIQVAAPPVRQVEAERIEYPGELKLGGSVLGSANVKSILLAPYAVLQPLLEPANQMLPVIGSSILKPHWLTVIPGNRFVGGPSSGLILGGEGALATVRGTALWSALRAPLGTIASLLVTLQAPSVEPAPAALATLLATSVENLHNRCTRLATQLAGEPLIASCQILSEPARLANGLVANIPSRQLKLATSCGDYRTWQANLAAESPALLTRLDEEGLVVDLRWIPPQFDSQLVSLLTGRCQPGQSAP